jgi:putative ABC transport system permease protein
MAAERAYDVLLALFPRAFRDRFGLQLRESFRDAHRDAAARGLVARAAFWIHIVVDALGSAIGERLARPSPPRAGGSLMKGWLPDVGHALRVAAHRPALSLVIVATLALGIGANTAIFSLLDTVLLRPVPYRDVDRLVRVVPVFPAHFFDWRPRARSFTAVAWSTDAVYNLTGGGPPEMLTGYRFSANMLDVLGVQPALGRGFRPEEDTPGAAHVAILSHKLWHRRFGGDPAVLGRALTLNGEPYTVVGIMPPGFAHPPSTEIWTPIALSPAAAANSQVLLRLVGRLEPDVTRDAAQQELGSLYADLARRFPGSSGRAPGVQPFDSAGDAKPLVAILFAGVVFVLLIACANVANLLLADAVGRRRELAIRRALGATRARVARQMLTESMILALVGGAIGALITFWTRDTLVALFPTTIANLNLPRVERIDFGPRVLLFALLVSVGCGVLFGLLPAWNVGRAPVQDTLKEGDRGGSAPRRTLAALVIAQVALSVVLLSGAVLMVQSFVRLQQQRLGFDADGVLSARLMLPRYRYTTRASAVGFTRALIEQLHALPGVESVGVTNYLPLSGWWGNEVFRIEGRPAPARDEEPNADLRLATEDYFRTMGIPLVAGRTFAAYDSADAPRVVVVNETLAKRYWPGENPVGRRILIDGGSEPVPHEVVGVLGDVKSFGLDEETHAELFHPYAQAPSALLGVVLRVGVDPAALAGPLRHAVWSIDPDQPVTYVMPMTDLAAESLAFRRNGMLLSGGFGLMALALAAMGIYGVLNYSVSRRTREIGVRMALGATRREVIALVMREGFAMIVIGLALGLGAALAVMRSMASVLYGVRPGDPLSYAIAVGVLVIVAVLATWLPARRATVVDPLTALRAE